MFSRLRAVTPEVRASIFQFTVYLSTAVTSVYFAVWLANRGITPDEIGLINALPVLVMLLINLFVGRLADRASDWRQAIIVLALIAGAMPIGLFFVSGFWGILLVWMICIVPAFSLTPIVDAASLRMAQRNGTDFGAIRAWATVGYLVSTAVSGPILAAFGDQAFLPLFLAASVTRALLSLQLPRFRAPPVAAEPAPLVAKASLRPVLKPWFVLTVIGVGMHMSIHGVLAAFGSLLWVRQGISPEYIGPLITVMAAAEALMMFVWKRLNLRISARHMIIIAASVGAFRWGVMAFEPSLAILFGLQLLHGITYAIGYFGGMQFIANWTGEEIAAEAQGFLFVIQQAMGVVSLVAFGWCVTLFGPLAWLAASAFCALGALLVVVSLRLQPAHR